METEILQNNLIKLKLSGIAKTLTIRLHEAEEAEPSYAQFLASLLSEEINRRKNNLHNKRLREARFPELKTIDNFNFNFNETIKKREVLDLLTCRLIVEKRNVLFIGPPGVGKTHLAIAFGIAAVEKGYEVHFRSIYDFLDEMAIAIATHNRAAFMKKMVGVPLLILDEFGIKNIPSAFSEDLIEIFHRRYGKGSTVICTNRPVQDWGVILGDTPAATSILDRFLEGIKLFKIKGESHRLQEDKTMKTQGEAVA